MDSINNISEIVCGLAKGADSLGKKYAEENSIKVKDFPAEWKIYGRKAGILRNEKMGNYADIAIVFWDGKSIGSKHMIQYMKKLGKLVSVVDISKGIEDW